MALRLSRAAGKVGVTGIGLLERAHDLAMDARHRLLDDDHDPRYLHPGRTALVALGDGGVRDAGLLVAALLLETVSPELGPSDAAMAQVQEAGLRDAWALARGIPRPGDEDLVERLVTADPAEQRLALSEWLDQLRHFRNWAPGGMVAEGQRLTREVYLPLAERGHGGLARRLRWWMRRVDPGLRTSS